MRHTYASFEIAAGCHLFELSRTMGTSVEQISKTYGHLLPNAADAGLDRMDPFDSLNVHSASNRV
jgi:hypothetical protein